MGELAARLLVVDDELPMRNVLGRWLAAFGEVDLAEDGDSAAELLASRIYDVIVSDISMPGMNGIELLRLVREQDQDVPIVLVTGEPGLETAMAAVEHGAFRYLLKPIAKPSLIATVRTAMNAHRMARLRRSALELCSDTNPDLAASATLERRFEHAIERIWMAFQPIIFPSGETFAYEALLRTDEATLADPQTFVDAAERLGRVHELGRAVRGAVAREAELAPEGTLIFVNCHPSDLDDDELLSAAAPLSSIASRVVLELTERSSLVGRSNISSRVERLRRLGYRVALDDLGAGYAGLSSFALLEPDFVKLDRSLVQSIDTLERKRTIVRAMLELCRNELSIRVVGEGVETTGERDVLTLDGCDLLQGFLIARPARGFVLPRG